MRARYLTLAGASVLTLAGCSTFLRAHQLRLEAAARAKAAQHDLPAVVKTVQGSFLMGTPIKVHHPQSLALQMPITLVVAEPESAREIASRITAITGIPVRVDGLDRDPSLSLASIPPPPPSIAGTSLPPPPAKFFDALEQDSSSAREDLPHVAIHYHGSLSGLLDAIAARSSLSWRFRRGRITLFRVESRTFEIPALPWSTKSRSSIIASAGASNSSSALGSTGMGAGAASATSEAGGSSDGSTSIINTSTTDVWKGLETTAKTVSDGARIVADPSSGTLTVTGTPDQIAQVSDWVHNLSRTLSKQVAISVHVYNVAVTNEQNYGFNPVIAFENAAQSYGLSLTGAPSPIIESGTTPFSFGANIIKGQFNGTNLAVQALATLGHVTQVFSRSIVTLNGQPAPIQVAEQTGYLAESEINQAANVGSTTGLIPGTVTTGFTATFVPRVIGDDILLGMNMTISSLVDLKTVTSGGASIQVPTTTDSVVQQSASLRSGATLMITGYKEADANTTRNGVGSPLFALLGGGGDAQVKHQMIAIVVTARIV